MTYLDALKVHPPKYTCTCTHDGVVSYQDQCSRTQRGTSSLMTRSTTRILIEWRNEQRAFVVLSDESLTDQFSEVEHAVDQDDERTTDQALAELMDGFQDCWDSRDFSTSMAEMQTLRTRVLTAILATRTPLRWLPDFLPKWQSLLSIVQSCTMQLSPTNGGEYIQELTALASGWKLVGDIVQARSTLVMCFEVTRQHLKTPFAKKVVTENSELQALRQATATAKKLLHECVAFQTSLARNKELFDRREAPPHVLASLSTEFWSLLRQAPLSVEVAVLLAHSLMKQRQFALVTRFLGRSPFVENPELALLHAKALAYMGFYRESIQTSQSFSLPRGTDEMASFVPLRAHCDCMKELIQCRAISDELLRLEHFEEAGSSYTKCLTLVDPVDHKQSAALLISHANALLGLDKISAAIIDFKKSLQLDPTNSLTSVRLQTACMQLETERIRNELSGTR